jgi:hypothetical protein
MPICFGGRPDITRRRIWWVGALVASCAVLVISCSNRTPAQQAGAPSQPTAQPAAQPAQPSTPAPTQPATASSQPAQTIPPANVIASGQYSADPELRCDLLEVKRVSGGALLVKWRVVNTAAAQAAGLAASQKPKTINYDGHWDDLYFIDPAENKKYSYLKDADGNRIVDIFWGSLAAEEQRANWAKFSGASALVEQDLAPHPVLPAI